MSTHNSALELICLLSLAEDYTGIRCPDCEGRLTVHQPDERLPERLLGTCRTCLAWFLIHGSDGNMLRLPDEAALKSAGDNSLGGGPGASDGGTLPSPNLDESANGPEMPRERRPPSSENGRSSQRGGRD